MMEDNNKKVMLKEQLSLQEFLEVEMKQIDRLKRELISEEENTNQLLGSFLNFLLENQGKNLRPKLTVLSANLFGKTNRSVYLSAILLEILHQATLLHDDVVDEAKERRGQLSANIKFGNKSSVLMGDYLLSKMIEACAKEKEFKLLEILSTTLVALSKGELVQLNADADSLPDRNQLLKIASMKTGSLITASCVSGAYAVEADAKDIELIEKFGMAFGTAYQIKDDILDYNHTNKEQFKDLKEKKINIPFALAMEELSVEEKRALIKPFDEEEVPQEAIKAIYEAILANNGIKKAEVLYEEYIDKSMNYINQISSDSKEAFLEFVEIFADRKI